MLAHHGNIMPISSMQAAANSDTTLYSHDPCRSILSWKVEISYSCPLFPLQDDGNFNPDDDDDDGDDGDPYYIMIPKADELMPKECIFDRLERAEADKWAPTLAYVYM